jgi:hypothetical protein
MKDKIKQLKAELKELAHCISETNREFKQEQREGKTHWSSDALKRQGRARYVFRHKHIVRCLLRGRTMEQIETMPKWGRCADRCYCCNKPDQEYINKLMKEMTNETLCNNESGPEQKPASSAELPCSGNLGDGALGVAGAEKRDNNMSESQGSTVVRKSMSAVANLSKHFGFS